MPDADSPDRGSQSADDASQPRLLGGSPVMQQALEVLRRAAAGTATVLLRGESGTGKEVAARALHALSPRAQGPFVKVDCTALSTNLLESELFGHEKGAFTGAIAQKPGRVELAEGGTLFLDEIGEISLSLQAKLLRLLQDREFERVGGTRTLEVDVRIVAATHRDLDAMITRGEFREDLFYRLNVVPVWLPPLRARREDIDVLSQHFCAELADGGTLFLDEIGEIPLALQAKLLRLLQDRQFERVGGTRTLEVDVRIVAATHRDLDAMITRGEFREDLFYRLNVVPVWLPPLRARREDIEALSQHFCAELCRANGKPHVQLDASAIRLLRAQRWPGNVRQLQNLVERLVVLAEGPVIDEQAVRGVLASHTAFKTQPATIEQTAVRSVVPVSAPVSSASGPLDEQVRAAEKKALLRALEKTDGNRAAAARLLGVSRSTFYLKLAEHGIE